MRQSLKIAISLLAALLLFAGFAIVAFSGLFNVLQASFFLPSIERVYQSDMASLAAVVDHFHAANMEAYRLVARKDFVSASFAPAVSDATLKAWSDTTAQLGLFGLRLLGSDGRRIIYSSFLDLDVKQRTAGSLAFKNYNEDGTALPGGPAARRARRIAPGPHRRRARVVRLLPARFIGNGGDPRPGLLPFTFPSRTSSPSLPSRRGSRSTRCPLSATRGS